MGKLNSESLNYQHSRMFRLRVLSLWVVGPLEILHKKRKGKTQKQKYDTLKRDSHAFGLKKERYILPLLKLWLYIFSCSDSRNILLMELRCYYKFSIKIFRFSIKFENAWLNTGLISIPLF